MCYDRIKQDVRSAETLAAALASGMQIRFEAPGSGKGVITSFASESDFYAGLSYGYTYHIETPKRRRPWTREEAEAHLGCVLVPPTGARQIATCLHHGEFFWWSGGANPSLTRLAEEGWQFHLPGHPKDLKPAYRED